MGSSLVATMANMVLLMPSFFLHESAKPMFYAGCIVTVASYGLILYYFGPLNSVGKALSKKTNQKITTIKVSVFILNLTTTASL